MILNIRATSFEILRVEGGNNNAIIRELKKLLTAETMDR